jgi:hypothetical protein
MTAKGRGAGMTATRGGARFQVAGYRLKAEKAALEAQPTLPVILASGARPGSFRMRGRERIPDSLRSPEGRQREGALE